MQSNVEKIPQSKIDFAKTKADRNILSLYSRFKKEYSKGNRPETFHKKEIAAMLVELGYEYLRFHNFNLDNAKEAIK